MFSMALLNTVFGGGLMETSANKGAAWVLSCWKVMGLPKGDISLSSTYEIYNLIPTYLFIIYL